MSEKWTEGPWEAYNAGDEGDTYIGVSNGNIICEKVGEANARLISAAPDLLVALENLLTAIAHLVFYPDDALVNEMAEAETAITKATGE